MLLLGELMLLKSQIKTKKSRKVDLKIRKHCLENLLFKIIETMYEHFNTHS